MQSVTPAVTEPVDEVAGLFAQGADGVWRLQGGETNRHECKETFRLRGNAGPWLRTVAALSNNEGGRIFFGVNDALEVCGMRTREFQDADPAEIARALRSTFDPTPIVRMEVRAFSGREVGILTVEAHPMRPVIAVRMMGSDIREGDILFRYPGESTRIKHSDLRGILDERSAAARREMMPMIERLLALGPSRAMVADLSAGALTDGRETLQIDPALLEQITFIKEGQFSERDGAPTLRLIGEVRTAGTDQPAPATMVMHKFTAIESFLEGEIVGPPADYIRWVFEAPSTSSNPFWFFARNAGMGPAELREFLESCNVTFKRRVEVRRRIGSLDAMLTKPSVANRSLLAEIDRGVDLDVPDHLAAANVCRAVSGVPADAGTRADRYVALLKKCLPVVGGDPNNVATSCLRRAVCRLDEVVYGMS